MAAEIRLLALCPRAAVTFETEGRSIAVATPRSAPDLVAVGDRREAASNSNEDHMAVDRQVVCECAASVDIRQQLRGWKGSPFPSAAS